MFYQFHYFVNAPHVVMDKLQGDTILVHMGRNSLAVVQDYSAFLQAASRALPSEVFMVFCRVM